jgi:hypothetical protein
MYVYAQTWTGARGNYLGEIIYSCGAT